MCIKASPAPDAVPERGPANGCCGSSRVATCGMTAGWTWTACGRLASSVVFARSVTLLRPYDVLVTARAGSVQVALVPPDVSRTVAGITMLVVRPKAPESGMGHWLWYFLTSAHGRAQLAKRITVSATLKSLSARNLGEVEVPVPSARDLDTVARLVEASESAYTSAVEAARLRRDALRDSLIQEIARETGTPTHSNRGE